MFFFFKVGLVHQSISEMIIVIIIEGFNLGFLNVQFMWPQIEIWSFGEDFFYTKHYIISTAYLANQWMPTKTQWKIWRTHNAGRLSGELWRFEPILGYQDVKLLDSKPTNAIKEIEKIRGFSWVFQCFVDQKKSDTLKLERIKQQSINQFSYIQSWQIWVNSLRHFHQPVVSCHFV